MRAPFLVLLFCTLTLTSPVFALDVKPYDAKSVAADQAGGKALVISVTAPWCPTCVSQHRAFEKLKNHPDLANLTIYEVDFDSRKDLLKQYKVVSQSTLVAFNGEREVGRIAGETKVEALEWFLKGATYKR